MSGQSDFTIHFSPRKKTRSKARSDRALEQKNKKKSRVEEGVKADNREYEEVTTDVYLWNRYLPIHQSYSS